MLQWSLDRQEQKADDHLVSIIKYFNLISIILRGEFAFCISVGYLESFELYLGIIVRWTGTRSG